MLQDSRKFVSKHDEAEALLLSQNESRSSIAAELGNVVDYTVDGEINNPSSIEDAKKDTFDGSQNEKIGVLGTVTKALLFGGVVLVALIAPVSTVAAIIFGVIYGFSWMLVFIPVIMWLLTGLLTIRLMIYKTGIVFTR